MAQNHIQEGKIIPFTLTEAVASGGVVVMGDLVGVASKSGAIGDVIQVHLNEVWELPKGTTSGTGFSVGTKLYWDATADTIVETDASGANKFIGYAFAAATDANTKCQVLLSRA